MPVCYELNSCLSSIHKGFMPFWQYVYRVHPRVLYLGPAVLGRLLLNRSDRTNDHMGQHPLCALRRIQLRGVQPQFGLRGAFIRSVQS